ncbi:MAG: M48 family metallopeptidase [Deltaproteobacteria bacterium]|nr:M48 family metallopeptidase [Deltaproteobacteria bacterium]
MNIIAITILAVIFAEFILNFISDLLNLRMLRSDLPDAFRGWYDADHYRKSQEYLKVNTRFGWVVSAFDLIVFLIFWFSKGFPLVDRWVQAYHYGPVITGMIFIGALALLKIVLSLPFSIYSTFVIEERFGFNKTTWPTFIKDLIKGLILTILLGGPILAAVLAFFEYAGPGAWLYCWIAVGLYMLAAQYIAPTWIMPLFNKFTILEDGKLKEALFSYARSIDFPLKNVFVMDGSRRSSKSNAFFTGFGKNKRIVLFDTLIKRHTVSELVAVLAHEMGHYKKKHIMKSLVLGIIQIGLMFFLLSLFISYQGLFDAFFMDKKSVYAGLIFFSLLYSPVELFIGLFLQIRSRKNEYEADRFSVETNKDSCSMVNALKKLSVHNLSNLLPHPMYVFLNYSHPPVLKRIEVIENL